jgi:hypothetical protein
MEHRDKGTQMSEREQASSARQNEEALSEAARGEKWARDYAAARNTVVDLRTWERERGRRRMAAARLAGPKPKAPHFWLKDEPKQGA